LLVCNDSTGPAGGTCGGTGVCTSSSVANGSQASCQYNTSGISAETNSWWSYACDSISGCNTTTANSTSPFNINHRPYSSSVSITPSSPNTTSTLTCSYTFNDDDSGDTEQSQTFEWYRQDEGTGAWSQIGGETASTLASSNFDSNDYINCSVQVTDSHGFSDDVYVTGTSDNASGSGDNDWFTISS